MKVFVIRKKGEKNMQRRMKGYAFWALLFLVAMVMGWTPTEVKASSTKPDIPQFTLAQTNNGDGMIISISECKGAKGYKVFYQKYNELIEESKSGYGTPKYNSIIIKKDGTQKRDYTIKKLKGVYKVYVRAYSIVNGVEIWGDDSAVKSINIQKPNVLKSGTMGFEFSDGTIVEWTPGDDPIDIGDKELVYVYFGNYPQTQISGKKLTKAIINAKYNANDIATVKGVKYKRLSNGTTYTYYRVEPIKWSVIKKTKSQRYTLLSVRAIDGMQYNDVVSGTFIGIKYGEDVRWEECSMRTFLNSEFFDSAFTKEEAKMIPVSKHEKQILSDNDEEGYTKEKVCLLSVSDIALLDDESSSTVLCPATSYAINRGAVLSLIDTINGEPACTWYLRTVFDLRWKSRVYHVGNDTRSKASSNNIEVRGVRPSIDINLSKVFITGIE